MRIAICATQRISYDLGEGLIKVGSVPGEGDEAIVAERLFLPLTAVPFFVYQVLYTSSSGKCAIWGNLYTSTY